MTKRKAAPAAIHTPDGPPPTLSDRIRYFVQQLMARAAQPGPNGDPDLELGGLAVALAMVANDAEQEIARLTLQRDLAQPAPTPWAYEQACKALRKHNDRADAAEAALAAFHEGEEPYEDEATVPTPAQWVWKWNRATSARRLELVEAVQGAQARADRCLFGSHDSALAELHEARVIIAAVRALHHEWTGAAPGCCAHCQDGMGTPLPYPCPTIQALDDTAPSSVLTVQEPLTEEQADALRTRWTEHFAEHTRNGSISPYSPSRVAEDIEQAARPTEAP
ncbi:hypothetical protein [Actinacidiphila rubida]|uniref:Uncharacterized protein n=1 Tax=Actinacidiphila rubida TaxID=310780 RepID=A0A1H8SXQ2_9ACTN|nr:hypothetical protein [Actinacidiphila rubida]SEO83256.1 hypothetical protein SAMN05216267_104634 [Actinacidiphila rubida]